MSYTRTMPRQYITVRFRKTVYYGASETGGSIDVDETFEEPIDVVVHVDTNKFDHEVNGCNESVDLLTGSVVATEAAQVASVRENSRKIGDTIIRGFFKTVQSDLTQQIAALQSNVDSLLIHLKELSNRCLGKRKQMQTDYQRISSRYLKLFNDLDTELENRIHAIDAPIFDFTRHTESTAHAAMTEGGIGVAAVASAENARLHAQISAAMAKKKATDAIRKSEQFLDVQYSTDELLRNCLRPGGEAQMVYAPYVMVETMVAPMQSSQTVYQAPILPQNLSPTLQEGLNECPWQGSVAETDQRMIGDYFNHEVGSLSQQAMSQHDQRVASMTARLFNLSQTNAPG